MTEIQFKKEHGSTTFRAFEGIIAKRRQDAVAPFIKRLEKRMFFFGDGTSELLADWLVDTSFTGHAPLEPGVQLSRTGFPRDIFAQVISAKYFSISVYGFF